MKNRHKRNQLYATNHLFIYPTKSDSFSLEGVINGKRIRLRYKSLQEAIYKCHDLEEGISDLGIARTKLNKTQLIAAEQAFDLLPSDESLNVAVRLYLKVNKPRRLAVKDAVWEFLDTKENCSKNTYDQAKGLLLKLVDWADGRTLDAINREGCSGLPKNG